MRIVTRKIRHPSTTDRIRLWPLGDCHVGARTCDEAALRAAVEEIEADPLSFWLGMGDYCDFVQLSDPRFAAGALAEWVGLAELEDLSAAQRDRFLEIVKPIADKCLALLKGNHENSIHRHYERAIFDEIVAKVKGMMRDPPQVLGLGYSGWVRLTLERGGTAEQKGHYWTSEIFAHHGWGGGRLAGGRALKLERAMRYYDADLILIGHHHSLLKDSTSVLSLTRAGRLRQRDKKGSYTGCWLRGHQENAETYAEVAGYGPKPIGCPEIQFRPDVKKIRIIS